MFNCKFHSVEMQKKKNESKKIYKASLEEDSSDHQKQKHECAISNGEYFDGDDIN